MDLHRACTVPIALFLSAVSLFCLFYRRLRRIAAGELAFREREQKFRSVFEQAAVGIALVDARTGTFLDINDKYCDITGYSREELLGKSCQDITHADDQQAGRDDLTGLLTGGVRAVARETRYHRKDGSPVWINLTMSPQWPEGQDATFHIAVVEDITARKAAETARERLHHESNELLQAVINGTNDAICVKDCNSRVLLANPAYLRAVGRTAEEVLGKTALEILGDTPAALSEMERETRVLVSGSGEVLEATVQGREGCCTYLGSKFPRRDVNGRVTGVICVFHDITAFKQAEEERLALEVQLQQTQKLESLGVLAGGIAHDFNNLLMIILAHCCLLKENLQLPPVHSAHLGQIETAAQRAADLCRQLLTYAAKSPMLQTQVNMAQLVDEVLAMLRCMIKQNVSLRVKLTDAPEIKGDRIQIQQVVMNLILNAAEAMASHIGTVRVELANVVVGPEPQRDVLGKAIPQRAYARLTVTDTGCGMSEEVQRRIFEPFFTTKITGRGLGMSAVLGILKSHDAALQLSSAPGAGTTCTVFFPLLEDSEPSLPSPVGHSRC